MENSEQYLTWEEFKAMGNTIDQMPFNIAETEARLIVDRETFQRFVKEETKPDELKKCMNKLINTILYDASYLDSNEDEKIKIQDRILKSYLSNTIADGEKALFRGK